MDNTQDGQEPQVIDGEIVTPSSEPVIESPSTQIPSSDASDNATVLLSLDEMIQATFSNIDRMSQEQKKVREMLADGFNNDAAFKQADEQAKAAAKTRSQIKQQVMNRPGVIEMANKLKDLNTDIKEKKASLSDYVLEYQRMAGVNQIEVANGEVLEIIQIAKLIKKFSKNKK